MPRPNEIPDFSNEDIAILQRFNAVSMHRLSFRQLKYIWIDMGGSVEGVTGRPVRSKQDAITNIIKNKDILAPVIRTLIHSDSSVPDNEFISLPRSLCEDDSVVYLLIEQAQGKTLLGMGTVKSSRITESSMVNVLITDIEKNFENYLLEYEDMVIRVGVVVPWHKDNLLDERVYLRHVKNQRGLSTFDDDADVLQVLEPHSTIESELVDQPDNRENESEAWKQKYLELQERNEEALQMLARYRDKSLKLEQFMGCGLQTMLDLSDTYRRLIGTNAKEKERFGFTMKDKFYEVTQQEHINLLQGAQPLVLLHLIIKYVKDDHLPLLESEGYCMPGTRKQDSRPRLDEDTVRMLTEDVKEIVPFFHNKSRAKMRRWLGETLSELNNLRRNLPIRPAKRARIE